ncbi:MAG: hypothetical protein J2P49_09735, partial [Methylocapsa sp.]|nr:hypothetical protein [Methylocapsa sp.]
GYNRINIARLSRQLPNVNSKIVGEWKSEKGPEHLVFRSDESVTLTVPGHNGDGGAGSADTSGPPPVTGKYKLTQGGKIYLQLMNGKKYTTTIHPINPNRFDLIDSETDGVTTYDRVAAAGPTEGKAPLPAPPPAKATVEPPRAAEPPASTDSPAKPAAVEATPGNEAPAPAQARDAQEAPPAAESQPAQAAPETSAAPEPPAPGGPPPK